MVLVYPQLCYGAIAVDNGEGTRPTAPTLVRLADEKFTVILHVWKIKNLNYGSLQVWETNGLR
jgi:hypothetical protein